MASMRDWLIVPQPKLGGIGLLVLLMSGSLVAPLSIDMYTPAVPSMTSYFSTSADIVNLTLVGFYFFMAVGLLIFGPLSDKYGRKPVLVGGMLCYCIASVLCALSMSIWMLVGARLVQAIGAGAMSAVCTAIVKDAYRPDRREQLLSIVQALCVVGPALAPIIGAGVLKVSDWRGTFFVLMAISLVELVLALLYHETLPRESRSTRGIAPTIGRVFVVGRDGGFMLFLLVTSACEIGYMAYVSAGSYIYIDFFGFSSFGFSLFFAAASLIAAVGPIAWVKISKFCSVRRFTTIALVASTAVGVCLIAFGQLNAFVFCFFILVFTFFDTAVRPYSLNILLSQRDGDTGAISSLFNFMRVFIGSLGMVLVMLPLSNYIVTLGVLITASMGLAVVGWACLMHSKLVLRGVKNTYDPEKML
ncbi:MAG: Bcr/CflA family efflux MFS transporter [Coriobacteriales bacterium]|jgi:DHA1 family bicyclomycin/chloramphenicol resistance-like MFS transporter